MEKQRETTEKKSARTYALFEIDHAAFAMMRLIEMGGAEMRPLIRTIDQEIAVYGDCAACGNCAHCETCQWEESIGYCVRRRKFVGTLDKLRDTRCKSYEEG